MIKILQSYCFIFVLLVFFSHCTWEGMGRFSFGGECGVSFFFILSGFVLSIGYGDKISGNSFSHKSFLLKQFSKFYPLHILTLAAYVIVSFISVGRVEPLKLLLDVFLLQSWIPDNTYNYAYNGVAWFLSDMVFFYLLFPWLYTGIVKSSLRRLSAWAAVVLSVAMSFVFIVPDSYVNTLLYVFPPVRCIDFAIGILIYRLYAADFTRSLMAYVDGGKRRPLACLLELVVVAIMVVTYNIYGVTPARIGGMVLFWLPLSAVIYLSAVVDNSGGLLARAMHGKILIRLGGLTLEFFMSHLLVILAGNTLLPRFMPGIGHVMTAFLNICATLAVSCLLKRYFVDKVYSVLKKTIIKT